MKLKMIILNVCIFFNVNNVLHASEKSAAPTAEEQAKAALHHAWTHGWNTPHELTTVPSIKPDDAKKAALHHGWSCGWNTSHELPETTTEKK